MTKWSWRDSTGLPGDNFSLQGALEMFKKASSPEEFEKLWRVNVLGVFWCMQEQIQIMKKQKSGHIVNIASIAGLHGIHNSGTYVATKHAVCKSIFLCA